MLENVQEKPEYFTVDDVSNGVDDLPRIDRTTQTNLRQKRRIKFVKVGGRVLYKKEWIKDYIDSNTFDVKRSA